MPFGNPMLNFSFGHNFLRLYKYHKMDMNKQIRGGLGVKEAGWTGRDFNVYKHEVLEHKMYCNAYIFMNYFMQANIYMIIYKGPQ
jgi:hypothetical protein